MSGCYSIAEYGTICRNRNFPDRADTFVCVYLPDWAFDSLRSVATNGTADFALTYTMQRGYEQIRLRNYVGLLETKDGVRLEILPKINRTVATDGQAVGQAALVKMLRRLRNSPFRQLGAAGLQASRLPLWEVFLTAFLADAQTLIAQGLQPTFVTEDVEQPFLRGKWRIADQLRQPLPRLDQLALRLSHCLIDTPPNRLLKSTLALVTQKTQLTANQKLAMNLLATLANVSVSKNPTIDGQIARRAGRLYDRYRAVLDWAELLLSGQVPGVSAGARRGRSLLFPMERVFEDYVSAGFRQYGVGVSVQESSAHLVEQHTDGPRFSLRPDIVVRQNGKARVFDMKWKSIVGNDPTGHYGLEQADLYQLYAYGQKYGADDVFLVFPANDTFREPLPVFRYDAQIRLHVVPVDLSRPLADEVEKLLTWPLLP